MTQGKESLKPIKQSNPTGLPATSRAASKTASSRNKINTAAACALTGKDPNINAQDPTKTLEYMVKQQLRLTETGGNTMYSSRGIVRN